MSELYIKRDGSGGAIPIEQLAHLTPLEFEDYQRVDSARHCPSCLNWLGSPSANGVFSCSYCESFVINGALVPWPEAAEPCCGGR